jgi:hypothetical protein
MSSQVSLKDQLIPSIQAVTPTPGITLLIQLTQVKEESIKALFTLAQEVLHRISQDINHLILEVTLRPLRNQEIISNSQTSNCPEVMHPKSFSTNPKPHQLILEHTQQIEATQPTMFLRNHMHALRFFQLHLKERILPPMFTATDQFLHIITQVSTLHT